MSSDDTAGGRSVANVDKPSAKIVSGAGPDAPPDPAARTVAIGPLRSDRDANGHGRRGDRPARIPAPTAAPAPAAIPTAAPPAPTGAPVTPAAATPAAAPTAASPTAAPASAVKAAAMEAAAVKSAAAMKLGLGRR